MKTKTVLIALICFIFVLPAAAQWCIECDVLPPCSGNGFKETFCGSYDNANPQGCWSYYKTLLICPQAPEDPVIQGNTYRTVWHLGFTCTGGFDCY
jgi:hypothetical protein